ncbi:MAG: sulfotransferase [Solirubrobacterales bacterium]
MNLFVQGMRRSGTTILYDALIEDPELRLFYEPLREEQVTVGGGSGARDTDAFGETRELRAEFAAEKFPDVPLEQFNWGGPREPRLEVEPGLPEHCREWLRHLLGLAPAVAIKETRFYDQIADLADLDPAATLAHVVRDPRAVTASIMLGRGRRRERKHFPTVDAFFEDAKKRRLWSSYEIAEALLERADAPAIAEPSSVERVLLVWKHSFETTFRTAGERFGERYVLLRNEDLRADTAAALAALYAALARPVPKPVQAWAAEKIRSPEEPYAARDRRWLDAFRRLEMEGSIAEAGYPELLDEESYDPPARAQGLSRLWR